MWKIYKGRVNTKFRGVVVSRQRVGLAGTDQGGARRYLIVSVLVLGLGGGATVALRYKEGNT